MKIWIPEIDILEGIFVEIIVEVLAAIWTLEIKGRGLVHGKAIVVPLWTLEVPMVPKSFVTQQPTMYPSTKQVNAIAAKTI